MFRSSFGQAGCRNASLQVVGTWNEFLQILLDGLLLQCYSIFFSEGRQLELSEKISWAISFVL